MRPVDLGPAAVAARLAEVSALNRLCDSLAEAGRGLPARRASGGYEHELRSLLGLDAVEAACSAAETAVQLVLKPAFSPELCISLTAGREGSVLEVRTLDRSAWAHWLALKGKPGPEPTRSWVRPHLSVETIDGVAIRAEQFDGLESSPARPTGIVLDGMEFAFTSWRAGVPATFAGNALASSAPQIWRLVDAAAELAQWERSRASLEALAVYRR